MHFLRSLLFAVITVAIVVMVLAYVLTKQHNPVDSTAAFLDSHWQHPIAPQGTPPAHFSALEASLAPQSCGQCHVAQYADWKNSLHSKSMTAGILWQFRLMDQAEANKCMNCHAPLAEQRALVAMEHGWQGAPKSAPPEYVPASLAHDGLSCAGCHIRQHQRFGPPPPDTQNRATQAGIHNGFTVSKAFEDSRFCATCHQFPEDGPRTAGKLREDTWQQWQASGFAQRGEQCQSCHMPDRKHQWRGVHDAGMIRKALDIDLVIEHGQVRATLTNSGAGHYFPTYMVPKISAQLFLLNENGEAQLLAEDVIGWYVDVSLQQESYDTRIPPGQSRTINASLPAELATATRIELRLSVAPREHYERTYLATLAQKDKLDAGTLALLQQSYDEAVNARYEALRISRPVSSF